MLIRPSKELRNNYPEISALAHEKKEPIVITKNGYEDLIVMSPELFSKRDEILKLRNKVYAAEKSRLTGEPTYTPEEIAEDLEKRYV